MHKDIKDQLGPVLEAISSSNLDFNGEVYVRGAPQTYVIVSYLDSVAVEDLDGLELFSVERKRKMIKFLEVMAVGLAVMSVAAISDLFYLTRETRSLLTWVSVCLILSSPLWWHVLTGGTLMYLYFRRDVA